MSCFVMPTIGLIGDYNEEVIAHAAIEESLKMAKSRLQIKWFPTKNLTHNIEKQLAACSAFWCVPGSPYENMAGALNAIRFAREKNLPFLGTCGGFQHAVIEYMRNVLGVQDADHAESNPSGSNLVINRLSCSMVEKTGAIHLQNNSQLKQIMKQDAIEGRYHCNYGFNPQFLSLLEKSPLKIAGLDGEGAVRAIELEGHPFFIATLFQPERTILEGKVHPLIAAFCAAVG